MTGPVDREPFTFLLPDQAPEAEQAVALTLLQVRVEGLPELTVLGLAWSVSCGAKPATVTVADCVAEPPGPEQVSS